MAKRRRQLSNADNKQLGKRLTGTRLNVYELAKHLFGFQFADEDFDKLRADAGVFKCAECGGWKALADEDPTVGDFCTACVDEINETAIGED